MKTTLFALKIYMDDQMKVNGICSLFGLIGKIIL